MAGSVLSEMVVAVSEAGGLGSLPCALLSLEQMRNTNWKRYDARARAQSM